MGLVLSGGGAYAAGETPAGMEALVREADWTRIFSDRAPREALGSQNLEEFLRGATRHGNDAQTLNDLPILFRAVATDLTTGEHVVLADGGLVRNLPVEVAREMGADVIIAVNVGTPPLPREAVDRAGVEVGKPVSNEQLVKAARVLHGSGEFEGGRCHPTARPLR